MKDSCAPALTGKETKKLKELAEKWMREQNNDADNTRSGFVNAVLTDSGYNGKGMDGVIKFLTNVLRYSKGKDSKATVPDTVDKMDELVRDNMDEVKREKDLKEKGRSGRITIGKSAVGLKAVTGVLDAQIKLTGERGSVLGKSLSNVVRKNIEAQIGRELGKNPDYKTEDDKFLKILEVIEGTEYTGNVGDLYAILCLASSINKEKGRLLTENEVRNAMKQASSKTGNDTRQIQEIRNRFASYIQQGGAPSNIEVDTMNALLSAYASTNPKFDDELMSVKMQSQIRSQNNPTRHYEVLAQCLRDRYGLLHNPAPVDISKSARMPRIRISPTKGFKATIEQGINSILDKHGKKPIKPGVLDDALDAIQANPFYKSTAGIIEWPVLIWGMVSGKFAEYIRGGGSVDWSSWFDSLRDKNAPKPDNSFNSEDEEIIQDLFQVVFKYTYGTTRGTEYEGIRTPLIESGARELEYGRLTKVVAPMLYHMRNKFRAEFFNYSLDTMAAKMEADEDTKSDADRKYRTLTMGQCELVFSPLELKQRASDVAHCILDYIDEKRWEVYKNIKDRMDAEKDEEKKHLLERTLRDVQNDGTYMYAVLKELYNPKNNELYHMRFNGEVCGFNDVIEEMLVLNAEGTEYGELLHEYYNKLLPYAFSELEEISGLRIILNDSNIYTLADEQQETTSDETNDSGASDTEYEQANDIEFTQQKKDTTLRENVDPYSTLAGSVKVKLARIPIYDAQGKPVVDPQTGNKRYYDPKYIFSALMAHCVSRMIDPKDLYSIIENGRLDDVVDEYPMIDENGTMWPSGNTERSAFPKGKPDFGELRKLIGTEPWAGGLIRILEEDYMDPTVGGGIEGAERGVNIGLVVSNLFGTLTFSFAERARFTSNPGKAASKDKDGKKAKKDKKRDSNFIFTNKRASVDSVRAVQRMNYMNSTAGMISAELAKSRKEDIEQFLKDYDFITLYKNGTVEEKREMADRLVDMLNLLWYNIEKGDNNPFFLGLTTEKNASIAHQINNLVDTLKNFYSIYEQEPNNEGDDTVYDNHGGAWDHLHEAVSIFVNPLYFQMTSTENGVTRQNAIAPNRMTRLMDIITYGWNTMATMGQEGREQVLKERRRRIDEEFGYLPKNADGEYENRLLRELYNGNDIPKNPKDSTAGVRLWGGYVLVNTFDDKEVSKLSAEERLELMLAAYYEQDQVTSPEKGGALYVTPVFGDTKAMVLTRGAQRSRFECIESMARFVRKDLDMVMHNRLVGKRWLYVHALDPDFPEYKADGRSIKNPYTQKQFAYDNTDVDWQATKIVRDWREAKNDDEKANAEAAWNDLLADNPDIGTLKDANTKYEQYKNWIPTDTFFESEQRINSLPSLNTKKMAISQLVDKVVALREQQLKQNGVADKDMAGELETFRNYITGELQKYFGDSDTRAISIADIAEVYIPVLGEGIWEDDYALLTMAFTEDAMDALYEKQASELYEPGADRNEKARLNQIYHAVIGDEAFDGKVWHIFDKDKMDKAPEENVLKVTDMSDKEREFYEMLVEKKGKVNRDEIFEGEYGKHKIGTIIQYRPSFVGHGRLAILAGKYEKVKKGNEWNQVHEAVKKMYFNTMVHNEELMEILGTGAEFFGNPKNHTKRLRGDMANGTRMDSMREGGREVTRFVIWRSDTGSVSSDLAGTTEAFAADVAAGKMSVGDALDKIMGWTRNNATNAQGYQTSSAYDQTSSMGGAQFMNPRIHNTHQMALNGKQEFDPRFRQDSATTPLKTMAMSLQVVHDPEGRPHYVPVYTKDTEVSTGYDNDKLGTDKSARRMAIERAFNEHDFKRGDEKIRIHKALDSEAVKSPQRGLVDMRFLQSRVDAIIALLKGEITAEELIAEFTDEVDNVFNTTGQQDETKPNFDVEFVNRIRKYLEDAMEIRGIAKPDDLTFDIIDGFIHSDDTYYYEPDDKDSNQDDDNKVFGLKAQVKRMLTHPNSRITADDVRDEIRFLTGLRNFMMPVKSTDRTIDELVNVNLRGRLTNEDGSLNENYVYEVQTKDERFQLRFSNHSVDSDVVLGSQLSFIIPSQIKLDAEYVVNGEVMSGEEVLEAFYKGLAARLYIGVDELKDLFADDEKGMRALQSRINSLAQNNKKFGNDVVNAVKLVRDRDENGNPGRLRFNTPLSSVSVIYKLSDMLTSFVRSATHGRKVNGLKAILEGDIGFDDSLRMVRDNKTGNIAGLECILPATSEAVMRDCIKKETINGEEVDVLDIKKLKEKGLDHMIAYRIPTEGLHSIVPLIVKAFSPQVRSGSVVVAGEVTALTGGDNDGDGLFIMVKNYDEKTGKVYEYDINDVENMSEKSIENMLIDIIQAVVSHPDNETMFLTPQNPDTYKKISREIGYLRLPKSEMLRKKIARRIENEDGSIEYEPISDRAQQYVFEPDDPDWDDPTVYKKVTALHEIRQIPAQDRKRRVEEAHEAPITSPFSIIENAMQQSLAKSGVAIGSDGMAIYEKIKTALRSTEDHSDGKGLSFEGDDYLDTITIDDHEVTYCPENDVHGNPVTMNMSNYLAALVDSAKDIFTILVGFNENNTAFAGFLMRCGFTPEMAAYAVAIMVENPNFVNRYKSIHRKLDEEGELDAAGNFGEVKTEDFKRALAMNGLLSEKALTNTQNVGVRNLCHVLCYLYNAHQQMQDYEKTTKFASKKHGLTNDAASAVYKKLLVEQVIAKNKEGKYPVKLPDEILVYPNLTKEEVEAGVANIDGKEVKLAMRGPQMYFTAGIESFIDVADKKLFYGNKAYLTLCRALSPIIMSMKQEDALKMMRRIHDDFTVFMLSDMKMLTMMPDEDGNLVETDFYKTRDYYRDQFPRDYDKGGFGGVKSALKNDPKLAALGKRLTYDRKTNRLSFDAELRNEANKLELRSALLYLANHPNPAFKAFAVHLFRYSYFSDGLRFSFGSISNEFTSAFLSSDAFKEYNEHVDALCTAKIDGETLGKFLELFLVNHAVDYQLGPLFRINGSELTKKSFLNPVTGKKEKRKRVLDLAQDEISQEEAARLEKYVLADDYDGDVFFDADPPKRILEKVKKLEPGSLFRVQMSDSIYDQNTYVWDGNSIIKVADMTSTILYSKDCDFEKLSKINGRLFRLNVREKNNGDVLVTIEANKDMVKSFSREKRRKHEKRMDVLRGKRQLKFFGPDEEASSDAGANAGDINALVEKAQRQQEEMMRQAEASRDMNSFEANPEDQDPMFYDRHNYHSKRARNTDELDTEEKEEVKKERSAYRPKDRTRMVVIDEVVEVAKEADEEPMYNIGSMRGRAGSKEEELAKAGANIKFRSKREAILAAVKLEHYVPTIEQREGGYFVEAHDATDQNAVQRWHNQYGKFVMEGEGGLNDVMQQVGDPNVDFVDPDPDMEISDYDDIVEDLGNMLEAAGLGDKLPEITYATAYALTRKLMGTSDRMKTVADWMESRMSGAEGGMSASEFFKILYAGEEQEAADRAEEFANASADERAEMIVEDLAEILSDPVTMLKRLRDNGQSLLAEKLSILFIDKTVLPALMQMRDTGIMDRLAQLVINSSTDKGTMTEEERQQARERTRMADRARNQANTLLDIVEQCMVMEERKKKMTLEDKKNPRGSNQRIALLKSENILNERGQVSVHGVLRYLEAVAKEYRRQAHVFKSMTNPTTRNEFDKNLDRLYTISRILQSHEHILDQLEQFVKHTYTDETKYSLRDGSQMSLKEMVDEIVKLHLDTRKQFLEYAPKQVIGFVKEFTGESYAMKRADGTHVTWEQLFDDKHGDVSWTDMELRALRNSKDPLGAVVAGIMAQQKGKVRERTIMDWQGSVGKKLEVMTLKELYDLAEKLGLKEFEYMFEHDENGNKTGYYVSDMRLGEFNKAVQEAIEERDRILNDKGATDAQIEAAEQRFKDWCDAHYAKYDRRTGAYYPAPGNTMWKSSEYEQVKADANKLKFLNEFMKVKEHYDNRLGVRTNHLRCIHRRMTSEQRFRANFTLSPKEFWSNLKRKLADDFLVQEDDYMEAGEYSTVLGFDNKRRLVTPAPYVRMLKNPNELSTDPIGSLMAYSYATNNYEAMREVTAPLEIMFETLVEGRMTYEEQAGRMVVEKFTHSEKQKAVVKENRFFGQLRSYLDSELYMRWNQDDDDVFTLFDTTFRKSKTVNAFTHISATAQLGFKWLVDAANLMNGLLQTNIEVAARRHFGARALAKADGIYWSNLPSLISDLTRVFKTNKLTLVLQALNVQQNLDVKAYNNARHSLVARLFNTNVAFMGTTGSNHWLYSRVAIAMMLETKVKYTDAHGNTVTTTLWDAYQLDDTKSGGKAVHLPAGLMTLDGDVIDSRWLNKFSEKIKHVNHDLFGIYNKDDMAKAQKVWYGRLLLAFKKHLVPMYDRRWKGKHFDEDLERDVQGFWRTMIDFLKGIKNAQFNVAAAWEELDEYQRADVRAAVTDMLQFAALLILANLLMFKDDDDDDESRLKKICRYLLFREAHEMGTFFNPLEAGKEAVSILENPTIITPQLEDLYNFTKLAVTPFNWDDDGVNFTWNDRVQGGPFAGQTEMEKRLRSLPIPVLAYYRNIDKSLNGVDNATWFYNRGYVGKV